MANDQSSSTSVVDQAMEIGRQFIGKLRTSMIGGYQVVGRWYCQRSVGSYSVFTLESSGKGTELLRTAVGSNFTLKVDWKIDDQGRLVVNSHGDDVYTHIFNTPPKFNPQGGMEGVVRVSNRKDSDCWFYPMRDEG